MAINDTNIIAPVESLKNIIVAQKKKEKEKKKKNPPNSAEKKEEEHNIPQNNSQAIMADNDKHLLDFKA